ncbi:hypothetical protein PG299_02610 [Riemerella anatipestifer]|nr:hypothetical protein [Riemerella anatipestifer]MDY3443423.1 hypothetical protein [Riemerella anatipestifer]
MKKFKLNIKALQDATKKKIQDKLKPIIVKHTQNGCKSCGK